MGLPGLNSWDSMAKILTLIESIFCSFACLVPEVLREEDFEQQKDRPRADGEGGVEQPEPGCRQLLIEATHPTHERVAGKKGKVI